MTPTYPQTRRLPAFPCATLSILCFALTLAQAQTTPAPAASTPVAASDASRVVLDEMVISGVRGSLTSAAELKQNAVQFVDSIVAQDIGKLPDNTVADALQR